jgi:benzoyl-CoA reductase/2-hydroxyglutaryl-CoA dehydratase subunit BcrC/BadD/HgdB
LSYEQATVQSNSQGLRLSATEKLVLGYIYPHAPVEIIMAHGLIPSLVRARPGVVGAFEASLQTFACSYTRNLFSQRVNDEIPPFAALLFPGNTCDSLLNVGDVWRVRYPDDVVFRLTYPAANQGEAGVRFLSEEIRNLSNSIEKVFGLPFSSSEFEEAASLTRQFREAIQFLYAARSVVPQALPYSKLTTLLHTFLMSPDSKSVIETARVASQVQHVLSKSKLSETVKRTREQLLKRHLSKVSVTREHNTPRVAVAGGMIDPGAIVALLSAAKIPENVLVMDFLTFGFKTAFTPPCDVAGEPFVSVARSILSSPLEPTQEGLEARLAFLKEVLTNLSIDGLVICEQSFCDPDEFEAPSLEAEALRCGVPVLRLPIDPELSDRERLGLRFQSFLETIKSKSEG